MSGLIEAWRKQCTKASKREIAREGTCTKEKGKKRYDAW
jgi:hypothetical protein